MFNVNLSKSSGDMEWTRKYNGRTDGQTDKDHSYNPPSASRRGINKLFNKTILFAFLAMKEITKYLLDGLARDNLLSPPIALVTYITSSYKIRSEIKGKITEP